MTIDICKHQKTIVYIDDKKGTITSFGTTNQWILVPEIYRRESKHKDMARRMWLGTRKNPLNCV